MLYNYDVSGLVRWEEVSKRLYGQPKLKKPSELKGIKESFKVKLHAKCNMSCFVLNDQIYIKCRDYFSSEDETFKGEGLPLSVQSEKLGLRPKGKKFIYNDNWGSIVLRNEAWLKVTGLKRALELQPFWQVASALETVANQYYQYKYGWDDGLNSDWIRFINDLVPAYDRYLTSLN